LFETFLINEFFKLRDAFEKRWNFSFLQTKDHAEIDLIIEKPRGKLILVEIKSYRKVNPIDLQKMKAISAPFGQVEKYLLSNQELGFEHDGIQCLHWLKGLEQIFELNES
jgi:hypothetical protein